MEFEAKIDHKKIKVGDEGSAFEAIAEGYKQWTELLKTFHKLSPTEQQDFIVKFGNDVNALLLILHEYANPRTDDVTDRGNQI